MAKKRKRITPREESVIADALRRGLPVQTAADLAGVSIGALHHSIRNSPALETRLRKARAEGQILWIEHLVQCAQDGKVSAATDALKLFYPRAETDPWGDGGNNENNSQLPVTFETLDPEKL